MKQLIIAFLCLLPAIGRSQDTTQAPAFTISGYLETYYSYDLNRPADNRRPSFLYNFSRHNEFNLNLGFIKGSYSADRVRANLAIGLGTYMNANYAAEEATLRHLLEANAGYRLSKNHQLWLDLGILPSHIGFESAIGKDNWTLSRSLVAENSPYFESGARLSYTSPSARWNLSALALNGWQRITRVSGNSLLSWGTQVNFRPSAAVQLNYSTFLGTDRPDSTRRWRQYHNLYGIFRLSERWGLTAGLDLGREQAARNSSELFTWYTPVAILRFAPAEDWALALRGEYFSDPREVLIATGQHSGFRTSGASLNIDYRPKEQVLLRLEGRYLHGKDPIFSKGDEWRRQNTALSFSTAIAF